jgi:mRNA interferase MazF
MIIERNGIYLANLDPVIGHEIAKTRPVVIVSNNLNNRYSGTVTVLPLSSTNSKKIYPFEVLLTKGTGNLPKNSKVKADQIRTLDKRRIVKQIGTLSGKAMNHIDEALIIHLSLIP